MKKTILALIALGIAAGAPLAAQADPASDLKQFRSYFKKKFPSVKFNDYANGFYALPGRARSIARSGSRTTNSHRTSSASSGVARCGRSPSRTERLSRAASRTVARTIAQNYPYWDQAKKEVRTAELDLTDCLKQNGEKEFTNLGKDEKARVQLAEVTAHFYSLYKGKRVKPDVNFADKDALAAYESGKKYWWTRRGQLNFACAHCHVDMAGKDLGGNQPLSAALGHTTAWPAQRLEWQRLETIMQRYATCNSQVRAKPEKHYGPEYLSLQLYETYMSSGLPLTAPAMRN